MILEREVVRGDPVGGDPRTARGHDAAPQLSFAVADSVVGPAPAPGIASVLGTAQNPVIEQRRIWKRNLVWRTQR
jgi:hypothetical protein